MSEITERPCRQLRSFTVYLFHMYDPDWNWAHIATIYSDEMVWTNTKPHTEIGNYQFKRFILFGGFCVCVRIFLQLVFCCHGMIFFWCKNYQKNLARLPFWSYFRHDVLMMFRSSGSRPEHWLCIQFICKKRIGDGYNSINNNNHNINKDNDKAFCSIRERERGKTTTTMEIILRFTSFLFVKLAHI